MSLILKKRVQSGTLENHVVSTLYGGMCIGVGRGEGGSCRTVCQSVRDEL